MQKRRKSAKIHQVAPLRPLFTKNRHVCGRIFEYKVGPGGAKIKISIVRGFIDDFLCDAGFFTYNATDYGNFYFGHFLLDAKWHFDTFQFPYVLLMFGLARPSTLRAPPVSREGVQYIIVKVLQ